VEIMPRKSLPPIVTSSGRVALLSITVLLDLDPAFQTFAAPSATSVSAPIAGRSSRAQFAAP
jgi:hypothetical protein